MGFGELPKIELMTKRESENRLRFEVATVNRRYRTVDEFQEYVRLLKTEGGSLNTILATEFSMNIREVIEKIEELKILARESGIDIIAAPGHRSETEPEVWGVTKARLNTAKVAVEETTFPDNGVPDSVGIFVGKNGYVFAFPKNFGNLETGNCVHRIPGTSIGVTICGEINHIKPRELEGITVLYNPSEEYDDPNVWVRMAQEAKGDLLTRDEVEELLLKDPEMLVYTLNEADYLAYRQSEDESLRDQIGENRFNQLFGNDPLIGDDETPDKRRERLNRIIDEVLLRLQNGEYDSMYVKTAPNLAEVLREKRIPVIRADGMKTSGVLNNFDGMKIDTVDIRPESTRISLSV